MVDPDWGELIRSELDSYVPERLPARFVPSARRQRRVPMVDWRPVAVTVGVLLLGLGFATVAGGPEYVYRQVTQMSPSRNVTPTPIVSSTPSPEQTTRPATPTSRPTPARTPGSLTPTGSGALQTPAPAAAGSTAASAQTGAAPAPSPSNQVCILVIGCL
jgi:hypothetical protein